MPYDPAYVIFGGVLLAGLIGVSYYLETRGYAGGIRTCLRVLQTSFFIGVIVAIALLASSGVTPQSLAHDAIEGAVAEAGASLRGGKLL